MIPPLAYSTFTEFHHPITMSTLLAQNATACHASSSTKAPVHGSGHLQVRIVDGQSSATLINAHAPLKLLVPTTRGPSVSAFISTFGGGLVAGDEIDFHVRVETQATLAIGTQSTTKVYRSESGLLAQQHLSAHVYDGALLGLLPDPVTCFAGSRYAQRQQINLTEHGSLLMIDPLTSGRTARDERWAFQQYESHNLVTRAGRRIVIDATRLDNASGTPIAQRMGRFQALATILLLGPRCAAAASTLLAWHKQQPINPQADLLISASPIADGALLRLGATRYDLLEQNLRHHLGPIINDLFGDHWQRKP
jgi:urease accessory protein